jgi:pyruvate/2-oxoglutarate dehydrogenase complex dihydrolipoamide dehydrogenase (E3) component
MARTVLRNALFHARARVSALVIPWCTYTDPEVAHVGISEAEARVAGPSVATLTHHLAENDRAILDGDEEGFARVHYAAKTGAILGGTIVARHAGEMIGVLSLAMTAKQPVSALSSTILPYPTQAESLKRLGDAYMRTRLTPTVAGLFRRWFAWTR